MSTGTRLAIIVIFLVVTVAFAFPIGLCIVKIIRNYEIINTFSAKDIEGDWYAQRARRRMIWCIIGAFTGIALWTVVMIITGGILING